MNSRTRRLRSAYLLVAMAAGVTLISNVRAQQAPKQEVPNNIAIPAAPEQPLPFNHKAHVSRGVQCTLCHVNPDPGAQMTLPATTVCMGCHQNVAKDRPSIIKLAALANSNTPIPWVRVYQITQGVTWTHRKHLQAGLQCVMCHGAVGEMETMSQATAVLAMGSCINCHQSHNAPVVCQTCHAWPKD
ncbi:MAG: cytochrome c3 family protein, partial [Bryobacteraceae bacterium]